MCNTDSVIICRDNNSQIVTAVKCFLAGVD